MLSLRDLAGAADAIRQYTGRAEDKLLPVYFEAPLILHLQLTGEYGIRLNPWH
ncbi:hypothetical protein [Niabella drilacis]|uniref:hypothetical protein n=1 Tax=Niabella drilacis (strain DSM 25811 / CCM 8410 / CCUG 62505 / LMG 26954 / E90) TaxID=1285928 RepID=UPI0015A4DA0E|nr:hypothetical protein [Niabella drilacis]